MDSFERISDYLGQLRRRLARVAAGEAAMAVFISVVGACSLALAAAMLLGQGPGRWALLLVGAGLVAAGWSAWKLWLGPRRELGGEEQLARWVERRLGDLRSGLISGVQAGAAIDALGDGDRERLGFSPALAHATADRAVERLDGVPPAALVDASRLRSLGRASIGLAAALVVVAALEPSFFRDGAHNLVAPARADPHALPEADILVDIAVGDLAFELHFPAYTGLQPRVVERTSGEVTAPAGTDARFSAMALHEATQAVLLLESDPEARWPLELGADGRLSGAFRVGADDRYQFMLRAPDGRLIRERIWRRIVARADLAPEVRLLLPDSDLEVHSGDNIPLLFEASDDFGIDRVELVITPEAGGESNRRVLDKSGGERNARGSDELAVAELDLEPGQTATIHFEAIDRNEVDGPGVGRSNERRITMYSPEAAHEELLSGLEKLIDRMIDLLADRLESPVEQLDPRALHRYVAYHDKVSTLSKEVLAAFSELVEEVNTDPLAGDELREGLHQAYDKLLDMHEQEVAHLARVRSSRTSRTRPEEMISVLDGLNREASDEVERAILTIKKLVDQSRHDKLLSQGRELLDMQSELRDLLEKLKAGGSDELTAEAQRKLDQLQENLRKMEDEMRKLAENVPYENTNPASRPSDTQVDMNELRDQIAKAKELIKEGRIDEALAMLEKLNTRTQQMMETLQDAFGTGSMPQRVQKAMQDFQQKLGEIADGQQGLHDETGKVREQMSKNLQSQLREQLQSARDKAEALQKKLDGVDGEPMHPDDRQRLDELRESASQLKQALDRGEVGEAAERATRMQAEAGGLRDEVGESESREMDMDKSKQLQNAMEQLGQSSDAAGDLAQELEGLIPKPGDGAGPGEKRDMSRLGRRQGQLGDELGGLEKELGELDKEIPGLEEQLEEALREAGQSMKQASDDLEQAQPGEAQHEQKNAIERLGSALDELDKQMQKSSGRKEQPGVGINDPRRKVEIPEAEDYQVPEAFREEILRAMKENAPERFKKDIEKFYEELVK